MKVKMTLTGHMILITLASFCQEKIPFEPAEVNFTIRNAGLKVNGSMTGLNGFMVMDPNNSDIIKIEGTVNPATIKTGIALRDAHLKKADYFNVQEYPKMFMTSMLIKKTSFRKYVGNFYLTIKGKTKSITIPFTVTSTKNGYFLRGGFAINRLDFALGEKSLILSDDVTVKIEFTTVGR